MHYINSSVDLKVLTMPLTAQELPKKVLGKYSDGDGLLFRVTRGGTRDWFLKVQYKGKRKEYALGKYPELGLSIEIEYFPFLFLSISSDVQASPTL